MIDLMQQSPGPAARPFQLDCVPIQNETPDFDVIGASHIREQDPENSNILLDPFCSPDSFDNIRID